MDRASLLGTETEGRGQRSVLPWVIAALVVVALAVAAVLAGHGKAALPAHAEKRESYGEKLAVTGIVMSQSTSFSGFKSIYIDGKVKNTGDATVVGAVARVAFANDELLPPQVVTQPLLLIRTREPAVDLLGLGDAPLSPGSESEFRLVFENIGTQLEPAAADDPDGRCVGGVQSLRGGWEIIS